MHEMLTVIFLDLKGSTAYAKSNDPELVLMTINQIFSDLVGILENHDITVTQYLGDGFMALIRGHRRAYRVAAALAMEDALIEFNQPRRVLGLARCLLESASTPVVFVWAILARIAKPISPQLAPPPTRLPGCNMKRNRKDQRRNLCDFYLVSAKRPV